MSMMDQWLFNIKWYETLTDRVSESTLQLTIKHRPYTDSGVRGPTIM